MGFGGSVCGARALSVAILVAAAGWVARGPALASQVRPVNLEQMTERAARIFSGRCLGTEVVVDPALGAAVTVATFEVDRVVKGDVGRTVSVRMPAGDATADGIAGAPRFRPGDEVVLFLYGESALGLSSPVGLGQGRFTILRDKLGRRVAVNDFANRNLLAGLTPAARTRLGASLATAAGSKALEPQLLLDLAEGLVRSAP